MSISQAEMRELLEEIQGEEMDVRSDGQKEYAHDSGNALGNFDRTGEELMRMVNGLVASKIEEGEEPYISVREARQMVLWVFFRKHVDGIASFIAGHRSQREDVRGRIKDARMYLALLWGMVEDDEREGYSRPEPLQEEEWTIALGAPMRRQVINLPCPVDGEPCGCEDVCEQTLEIKDPEVASKIADSLLAPEVGGLR